jgi:hypothetical protein
VWWKGNSVEVNAFLYGYESVWLPASLFKDHERLADASRRVDDALADPRPLHAQPGASVRRSARDLTHALNTLERWLDANGRRRATTTP